MKHHRPFLGRASQRASTDPLIQPIIQYPSGNNQPDDQHIEAMPSATLDNAKRLDQNALDVAFGARLLITLSEASRVLAMDARTLREHTQRGEISFTQVGQGTDRVKRCFTRMQLFQFVETQSSNLIRNGMSVAQARLLSSQRIKR